MGDVLRGRLCRRQRRRHQQSSSRAATATRWEPVSPSNGPRRPHGDERDDYETDPAPDRSELMTEAIRDHFRQIGRIPQHPGHCPKGVGRILLQHPSSASHSLAASTLHRRSWNHVLTPNVDSPPPLALDDVKEVRKQLGVTINDVVLTISTGAVRKLLLKYDGCADQPLSVSVPISVDRDPNRIWGNKFTTINVRCPLHSRPDRACSRGSCRRHGCEGTSPGALRKVGSVLPPAPVESMSQRERGKSKTKTLNFAVSNAPGPRERGSVAGAVIREIYSVGPLIMGSGLNITVWSDDAAFHLGGRGPTRDYGMG